MVNHNLIVRVFAQFPPTQKYLAMMIPRLVVVLAAFYMGLAVAAPPLAQRLPEIKYADLVTQDPDTAKNMISYFTQLGALQITGIPRFAISKEKYLVSIN